MNRIAFAVALAAVLSCPLCSSLRAQEPGGQMDPPEAMSAPEHESAAAKWKDKLGLTDEQVDKLKAAMKARREAMEPLVKQMKGSMKKLQDQVKAKSADADIQAVLDELEQARQGMRAAMEKFKTDTAFLSATQHAKMMLHYMHHGGMHHGKGAKASPQQQLGTKPAQ